MRTLLLIAALLSLALCLAFPVLFFLGRMDESAFKTALALSSLGWFVFAFAFASSRR